MAATTERGDIVRGHVPSQLEKAPMEKELAEIRKEIVEARNLVIKNDNLIKNLGSDLKALGRKQEAFEKRQWIASAAAYLAFAAMAAGAGFAGARGYVAKSRSDAETQAAAAASAHADAEKARADLAAMEKASESALVAYQKLSEGSAADREKAAEALRSLDRSKLSKLEAKALDDHSRGILQEIAGEAMEAGKSAFRHTDYKTAAAQLGKALSLWPDHPEADDVMFYLGDSAMETRDYATAASSLQRFIDHSKAKSNKDYAFLLLGEAYEALGDGSKAEAIWTRGSGEYPNSQFNPIMRRRLSAVRKARTADAAH